MIQLSKNSSKIYFLGIGGTGMAAVAGLLKSDGYQIVGSDKGIYPPMSHLLEALEIKAHTPYDADNIEYEKPDVLVVGNSISKGHVELEAAIKMQVRLTSFPEILEELYLNKANSIVITGTHGKTTTTTLTAHLLNCLGEDPSFLVGGLPKNFPRSFYLGKSEHFVIEGDEYDTVYYDKGPKFLHYCPDYLLIGNIEYDHADIYQSVEEIYQRFQEVIELTLKRQGSIVANLDDAGLTTVLSRVSVPNSALFSVGQQRQHDLCFRGKKVAGGTELEIHCPRFDAKPFSLKSKLMGLYNEYNLAMAVGSLIKMSLDGKIHALQIPKLQAAVERFTGVHRRLDLLFDGRVKIYEDFAHHPTAVANVLRTLREHFPGRRIIAAFEPANATSRRNVFSEQYSEALRLADEAFLGASPVDLRIQESERMSTQQIAEASGKHCQAFANNQDLLAALGHTLKDDDVVVFMSSSSFGGIQYKLAQNLGA